MLQVDREDTIFPDGDAGRCCVPRSVDNESEAQWSSPRPSCMEGVPLSWTRRQSKVPWSAPPPLLHVGSRACLSVLGRGRLACGSVHQRRGDITKQRTPGLVIY